jgi:diguanylate cyclase (GGDEF)-like protein/PAS domain S-box-containing protein
MFQFTFLAVPIFLAAIFTLTFSIFIINRKFAVASIPLAALNTAVTIWSVSYLFELLLIKPAAKYFWLQLEYLGIVSIPVFWLLFCFAYTQNRPMPSKKILFLLSIVPVITLLLVFTNSRHGLIWSEISSQSSDGLVLLDLVYGNWFWIHTAYSYLLFSLGLYFLIQGYLNTPKIQQNQIKMIMLAALFPVAGNILYLSEINPFPKVDLTSISFAVTGLIIIRTLFYHNFLNIIPIGREVIFDRIADGVLVVNLEGYIVDLNRNSELLFGMNKKELIGKQAREILLNYLDWEEYRHTEELVELQIDLELEHQPHTYQIRINPLFDNQKILLGHSIVFHNYTETIQLYQELQDQAARLTVLYEVGKAISSTIEIDDLLDLIFQQIRNVIPSDAYFVSLYDPDNNILDLRVIIDEGNRYPPEKVPANQGLSSWIVKNKEPLLILDLQQEIDQLPVKPIMLGEKKLSRSWLGVPLLVENHLLGILAVTSYAPHSFSDEDQLLLTQIAQQAALSIENARHHEEVENQARLDSLTQVSNHSHFIEVLHKEAEHAKISNQPLSIIMLDIDHFKKYNDTYGHVVGDRVLKLIVKAIQSHIKTTDTIGRWGGEEFGICLPNATTSQANMVANRIRSTLSQLPLEDSNKESIPKPTISQGIATLPNHSEDIDKLVIIADRALYRAKDKGRDQIAVGIPENPAGSEQ